MRNSGIWAAALAMLVLFFSRASYGADQNTSAPSGLETIKIAYLPITHALPAFAAKDLAEGGKISREVNIELVKFSSWPELTDALNTGRVDGASMLIELAVKAKEQGIDLALMALGHHDGNVVVVSRNINSAEELKGKTIAIPHRQSSHNILVRQLLENAHIGISEVHIVEMAPPEMPSALSQGAIDGYCVAEPFGAKSVTAGFGKTLFQSGDLWKDSICCALVLNNSYIKAHPDAAKAFARQYGQAGNYLSQSPDETLAVAKNNLTVDDATLKLSLEWISFDSLRITKEDYKTLTEKMVRFGLTNNPPSYENFVASGLTEQ